MIPIIINNELSGLVLNVYDNSTSLAIDGVNGTWFEIETDTDGVLSLVNDAIGVQYGVLIENTNTTDVITIALPVNDKKPSNVITIAPLRCRELSLLRLSSTKRIIEFGELISWEEIFSKKKYIPIWELNLM